MTEMNEGRFSTSEIAIVTMAVVACLIRSMDPDSRLRLEISLKQDSPKVLLDALAGSGSDVESSTVEELLEMFLKMVQQQP